ncbi:MAG TPA: cysteine desulfurase family protein [Acidimicrobiia bacterium]
MIYLDHAATTPMRPGVWDAMAPFAGERFGNPSGIHGVSRRAKDALEEARERVAARLGAKPSEIVFTSGGTESDNLAIKGAAMSGGSRRGVVTVATEHEAVLSSVEFLERLGHPVRRVGVDHNGLVDPQELVDAIDETTAVVSVMAVNNETGVTQDVVRLARLVAEQRPAVLFHTDAIQAHPTPGLLTDDLHLLSLSAHKFGGPKGSGVLFVRDGVRLEPVIHGGGQEAGRRSGTTDVAAAVGFATALDLAAEDHSRFVATVGGIRDDFEKLVADAIPDLVINGGDAPRSPQHSNLRIPGVRNESLLIRLDRAGVAASAGSACQSGAPSVSHVLAAMGLTREQVRESVRFSFGWTTTQDEAREAAGILVDAVEALR